MSSHNANQSGSETSAKAQRKAEEIWHKWRGKSVLDVLIYICGTLVIVGGLWLGYLGVSGHLKSQKALGLWVLYGTLFFVLTGSFLYFQKLIWEAQTAAVTPPDKPLGTAEKVLND